MIRVFEGVSNCFVNPERIALMPAPVVGALLTGKMDPRYEVPDDVLRWGAVVYSPVHPLDGLPYKEGELDGIIQHEMVHAQRWHDQRWSARNYGNPIAVLVEEYAAYRGGSGYGRARSIKCAVLTVVAWFLGPFGAALVGRIE